MERRDRTPPRPLLFRPTAPFSPQFRTLRCITLEELIPDEFVIENYVKPSQESADTDLSPTGKKLKRMPHPILKFELSGSRITSSPAKARLKLVRDQITNYLSGIFVAGHVAEALHDNVISEQFVWALLVSAEQGPMPCPTQRDPTQSDPTRPNSFCFALRPRSTRRQEVRRVHTKCHSTTS